MGISCREKDEDIVRQQRFQYRSIQVNLSTNFEKRSQQWQSAVSRDEDLDHDGLDLVLPCTLQSDSRRAP